MSQSFYPVISSALSSQSLRAQQDLPVDRTPSGSIGAAIVSSNGDLPTASHRQQHNMFLRVHIASQFRIQPPVPFTLECNGAKRDHIQCSFDLERRLLQEEQNAMDSNVKESTRADDPFLRVLETYVQMGLEKEEVALALAAYDGQSEQSQVVEFCKAYRSLVNMGFASSLSAGALIEHENDLNAAAEACLKA